MTPERVLELARLFHDTYERLAPQFGYVTRIDTRQFDAESANGRLMIAVCAEVASAVEAEAREKAADRIASLVVLLTECADHFKTLREHNVFVWPHHPMNPEDRIAAAIRALKP